MGIYHHQLWKALADWFFLQFVGFIIPNCNWDLLQETIMYKLIREVMFCGSVAVPAMVAPKQVDSRYGRSFLFVLLFQYFWDCENFSQSSFLYFLQIQLNSFDPGSSSTSQFISCTDKRCSLGVQSSDSDCSTQNNQCSYTFQYGDGSGTSGYYVSDLLHLQTILEGSMTQNSSASIVFGWVITSLLK